MNSIPRFSPITLLIVGFVLCAIPLAFAGDDTLPGRSADDVVSMDANFKSISILDIDVSGLVSSAKSGVVSFPWGDSTIELSLENSNLWTGKLQFYINDGFNEIPVDLPDPFPYKGQVVGDPESHVRLTISADLTWVRGHIAYGREYFIIEQRKNEPSKDGLVEHYVYRRSDLEDFEGICGTDDDFADMPATSESSGPDKASATFYIKPYGDAEFYNINPNDWNSRMVAEINSVSAIFERDVDVVFQINGAGTFVNLSNQPLRSSSTVRLMGQLVDYFKTPGGVHRQLVHLLTGKDLTGDTLGMAKQAQSGRCLGYSLCQLGPTYYLSVIVCAHEIGHIFNANHEYGAIEYSWDPTCLWEQYTIMQAPQINPLCMTDHFSATNKSRMEVWDNKLTDFTPPPVEASVDYNATYTRNRDVTVEAYIQGGDMPIYLMVFANYGEPFAFMSCEGGGGDATLTLPAGDGLKRIQIQVYDEVDNLATIIDTIILDQTPPSLVPGYVTSGHLIDICSTDRTVSVTWDPASDATSGIGGYSYSWTEGATSTPDDTIDQVDPGVTISSGALSDGQWYFNIHAIDNAGWTGPVTSIGPFIIAPAPAAPESLWCTKDTVDTGEPFTLEWSTVADVVGYDLYQNGILVYRGIQTDTSLICGTEGEYVYTVFACNDCGCNDTAATFVMQVILPSDVEDIENPNLPDRLVLGQNYPNPFNPETRIEFSLPRASFISLEIYNITGSRVRTLVNERLTAGHKAVTWDGRDDLGNPVSSGIFIYRLRADHESITKKMLLLR
jgi:hypothetical protein